jgi:hypothetical protein
MGDSFQRNENIKIPGLVGLDRMATAFDNLRLTDLNH